MFKQMLKRKPIILLLAIFAITSCELNTTQKAIGSLLYKTYIDYHNYYVTGITHVQHKEGNDYKVLILGDSRADMGEDWHHIPYTVYNVGIKSQDTNQTLQKLWAIDKYNPDALILFIGPNDERTGVTPDKYRANIEKMRYEAQSRGILFIILDFTEKTNAEIYLPYRAVMEEFPEYLPIEYILSDFDWTNVHLTDQGYLKVSQKIIGVIEK